MARSSGIPRRGALGAIAAIIAARVSSTTVSTPTETTGPMGETETTTSDHPEDLWVYDPQQIVTEVPTGERVNGELGALGVDGINVQKDDRITHGGVEYVVDSVIGYPEDSDADGSTHADTEYFSIDLVRRDT